MMGISLYLSANSPPRLGLGVTPAQSRSSATERAPCVSQIPYRSHREAAPL